MRIEAVDLFCGAGGLTYGLSKAGVSVIAGVDLDEACKYPYEQNNKATFVHADVAGLAGSDVAPMYSEGTVRLLAGCAPCQPFSSLRYGEDTSGDHKWGLLEHFARIVTEVSPELVTMENVPGVQRHAPYKNFVATLNQLGYSVDAKVVQCADLGLPQLRRRLVLMASRIGPIKMPKVSGTRVSVGDALRSLPPLRHGEENAADPLHRARTLTDLNLARAKASRPGGTWHDWPDHLILECHRKSTGASFKSVYGRMVASEPSPTITTQAYNIGTGRFVHPEQDRGITLREAAILQSFPKKYKFVRSKNDVRFSTIGRLIGNAVPPKLGEMIGRHFVAHVATHKENRPNGKSEGER
ncbi:DNA cytosine methyltransferase [Burkholderia stagnalis]|uniref:DNA cytosine methyltransferase n=1 Tax=Burkholderia stagnalis TaxID=1503054 RepID=UPI000F55C682|nr:DNA cytosine methyltransferase [Burkholderia stagnalis]RQQ34929.1 DNA cytosine methyltransferase [Burkholderia stagnalis]RQQ38686.1 DNA cytosine methyltransferase [Burkholderia stagnalis]RQQ50319.1 DNA cytosine methyltransferase [Burkholderia stagnalis]RQY18292.1 DNA cytosine methyltransferase [Burkholderia stagnalis]RQY44487.1 DNA cytosine methyltransferase [Burkholderia stagnalis]